MRNSIPGPRVHALSRCLAAEPLRHPMSKTLKDKIHLQFTPEIVPVDTWELVNDDILFPCIDPVVCICLYRPINRGILCHIIYLLLTGMY